MGPGNETEVEMHLVTYYPSPSSPQGLRDTHTQFQASLAQTRSDFKQLGALDRQIKSYSVSSNPLVQCMMQW